MRLDHQAPQEKKENLVYPVSLVILDHLERKETKEHLDGLVHPVTKEIEATLELLESVESRVREVSEDPAAVRVNKVLLDLKVTLDSPAHQARKENEDHQDLKEFEVLLDNRVFRV